MVQIGAFPTTSRWPVNEWISGLLDTFLSDFQLIPGADTDGLCSLTINLQVSNDLFAYQNTENRSTIAFFSAFFSILIRMLYDGFMLGIDRASAGLCPFRFMNF